MLVGNKSDLKEEAKTVTREEVNKYLSKHPKWAYSECSAKLNWHVKEMFEKVAKMVRETER